MPTMPNMPNMPDMPNMPTIPPSTARSRTALASSALCLLLASGLLHAGPLVPPAGPIGSSYKTLSEVEPRTAINLANTPGDNDASPSLYKITQPGSYYLTGNILGVSGKTGIEIASSGVTIDLMGFELRGVQGSLKGIAVFLPGTIAIEIRNGSVRDWGDDGIDTGSLNVKGSVLTGIRSSANGGSGVKAGFASSVSGCTVTGNAGNGIAAGSGSTISSCAADGSGVTGIVGSNGSTITACSAYGNTASGIQAGFGATVTGCTAFFNGTDGIVSAGGCLISNCTTRINARDGIRISSKTTVLGNHCVDNGYLTGDGAGIHATNSDNRIEGNNCSGADRGIDVDLSGNIIIKNTASGNTTNWTIAANNIYGPIIDRTAPATPVVNGNAEASTLGATDPNANFSY